MQKCYDYHLYLQSMQYETISSNNFKHLLILSWTIILIELSSTYL